MILVTGATGFIGGWLARSLVADGHAVRALVRKGVPAGRVQVGVEVAEGDLTDPDSLDGAASGCSLVYHVAAITGTRRGTRRELEHVNVRGTADLASAAARAGVRRFVHVSTCGVYGYRNRFPANETMPMRPDTPYRISKARAERAVLDVSRRTGLPVVVARLGTIYGPGGKKWLPLCRSVRAHRFRMIGDGRNPLHLGHVFDVVDGLRRCGETSGIGGRCYNLTGPEPLAIGEMVATIEAVLGARTTRRAWPALPFRFTRHVDLMLSRRFGLEPRRLHSYDLFFGGRWFDISRARDELDYSPRIAATDGVASMVREFVADGSIDSAEPGR